MKIKKELTKILRHFGFDNQRIKLAEECQEYLDSMSDEEIADVFIVSSHLVLNSKELQVIVADKIKRTLNRIDTGYYDQK